MRLFCARRARHCLFQVSVPWIQLVLDSVWFKSLPHTVFFLGGGSLKRDGSVWGGGGGSLERGAFVWACDFVRGQENAVQSLTLWNSWEEAGVSSDRVVNAAWRTH